MRKPPKLRAEFISLELIAISQVLRFWAKPSVVEKRKIEWPAKLIGLRGGVSAETGSGSPEAIPHELVRDEYVTMLEFANEVRPQLLNKTTGEAMKYLQENPSAFCKPTRKGSALTRPAPFLPNDIDILQQLVSPRTKLENVAKKLVSRRLGLSVNTVSNCLKITPRKETLPLHRHLASLFVDWASYKSEKKCHLLCATAADVLLKSGYPGLKLCYLVRLGHAKDYPLPLRQPDETLLSSIAKTLRVNISKKGPFASILQSEQIP